MSTSAVHWAGERHSLRIMNATRAAKAGAELIKMPIVLWGRRRIPSISSMFGMTFETLAVMKPIDNAVADSSCVPAVVIANRNETPLPISRPQEMA